MDESLELRLSLMVCLGLSGAYAVYALLAEPSGGHPFGHWLGIGGTLLMVITETAYSLRKRTRLLRWAGPVRYWLSAHIVTGLVGPFLVLMHTALQFRGLAGLTMALTGMVVGSGFLGRYLYTAIPHSLAGAEASALDLDEMIVHAQAALEGALERQPPAVRQMAQADQARQRRRRGDWGLVLLRGWDDWRYHANLRRQLRGLERAGHKGLREIETLLLRRRTLERQLRMLQAARRLLGVWHVAHVPMGMALFSSIAVHVAAEIYFGAGLLR